MRIKASALGLSAAVVMAVAFGICGLMFAILPGPTTAFASWVLHIDMTTMTRSVSIGNLIAGMLFFGAYVGLVVGLTTALYNRLSARQAA